MKDFGTILKELRERSGYTQQMLADKLNVGRATIAGYETKGKEPDYDKLKTLSEIFNVSVDYLLGNSDIRSPYGSLPDEITTADEAIKFLIEDSTIFGFDGFDVNKLSDEEKIEFANELLNQFRLVSYKYKK